MGGSQYFKQPNVEREKFRILKELKISCSILLFLYLFILLFERLKYMMVHKNGNLLNSDSFPNSKTLKIFYFSKLKNWGNFLNFLS